jgi:hypothetical protein
MEIEYHPAQAMLDQLMPVIKHMMKKAKIRFPTLKL